MAMTDRYAITEQGIAALEAAEKENASMSLRERAQAEVEHQKEEERARAQAHDQRAYDELIQSMAGSLQARFDITLDRDKVLKMRDEARGYGRWIEYQVEEVTFCLTEEDGYLAATIICECPSGERRFREAASWLDLADAFANEGKCCVERRQREEQRKRDEEAAAKLVYDNSHEGVVDQLLHAAVTLDQGGVPSIDVDGPWNVTLMSADEAKKALEDVRAYLGDQEDADDDEDARNTMNTYLRALTWGQMAIEDRQALLEHRAIWTNPEMLAHLVNERARELLAERERTAVTYPPIDRQENMGRRC